MSKSRDDEIYEKGVHDGQEADLFNQFTHNIAKAIPSTHDQDIYEKGFEYGRTHQSDRSDDDESSSGGSSGCFVSTACVSAAGLRDDCHELVVLRRFRDQYVASRPDGPLLIERYYARAPQILAALNAEPDASDRLRRLFEDLIVPSVQLIEAGRCEEALALYVRAVTGLEEHYVRTAVDEA